MIHSINFNFLIVSSLLHVTCDWPTPFSEPSLIIPNLRGKRCPFHSPKWSGNWLKRSHTSQLIYIFVFLCVFKFIRTLRSHIFTKKITHTTQQKAKNTLKPANTTTTSELLRTLLFHQSSFFIMIASVSHNQTGIENTLLNSSTRAVCSSGEALRHNDAPPRILNWIRNVCDMCSIRIMVHHIFSLLLACTPWNSHPLIMSLYIRVFLCSTQPSNFMSLRAAKKNHIRKRIVRSFLFFWVCGRVARVAEAETFRPKAKEEALHVKLITEVHRLPVKMSKHASRP